MQSNIEGVQSEWCIVIIFVKTMLCCLATWRFFGFCIYWISCLIAQGLAPEELVVAETPISELPKPKVAISTRISIAEDACPFVTNHNSGGEFKLFLFADPSINFAYCMLSFELLHACVHALAYAWSLSCNFLKAVV